MDPTDERTGPHHEAGPDITTESVSQATENAVNVAAILRAPFPPEKIGKLPRVTCAACRDARTRVCEQHSKTRCDECGNWITGAHLHLDYVGHADVTDRLLEADPAWTWTPLALDPRGLPAIDENGGMWILLTVGGVTRLGYGDAAGKRGGDAVKEAIGDAIRNGAMRFGVALDLWRKEPPAVEESEPRRRPAAPRRRSTETADGKAPQNPVLQTLMIEFRKRGYATSEARRKYSSERLGFEVKENSSLSDEQMRAITKALIDGVGVDTPEVPHE